MIHNAEHTDMFNSECTEKKNLTELRTGSTRTTMKLSSDSPYSKTVHQIAENKLRK